jgi:hypothetical protein
MAVEIFLVASGAAFAIWPIKAQRFFERLSRRPEPFPMSRAHIMAWRLFGLLVLAMGLTSLFQGLNGAS